MSHRYSDFLCQLSRGPIAVNHTLSPKDGETISTGRYFEVTRTVMRLEYAGYQYRSSRHRIPRPYVREVYSCGHSAETTLGCYNWRRLRKTACCYECSKAIPAIDEEQLEAGNNTSAR